jgi:hypothetical protein
LIALVAIDTIVIDGSSTFESDIDLKSPEMYLFLDRSNSLDNNLLFFAEPGNININEIGLFLYGAKITGSKKS